MNLEKSQKNYKKAYPSQVFFADNIDPFTNRIVRHPFVVWYSQSIDDSKLNNNIYALKITSQVINNNHLVPIPLTSSTGLDKISYVCCDNLNTFDVNKIEIVGQLDSSVWLTIMQERQKVIGNEFVQNARAYANMKVYDKINQGE